MQSEPSVERCATGTGRRSQQDDLPVVRRVNGLLEAAWSTRLLPEPSLEPDTLTAEAMRKEHGELEGGQWEAAFRLLAGDLRDKAELNALGRTIAHGQLVGLLRQRLRAAELFRRHPEIGDDPVENPVIILGHMRSGTTRLHRLLACDDRFSFTRLHESLTPLASSGAWGILSTATVRALLNLGNPELRRIHPTHARAAEEEFGLHALSIHGAMFEAQWYVPQFARWSERRDLQQVYSEFRRLVQMLRWRRGESVSSMQLLKAPQFMQDLDAVASAFPRARFLWIQRSPLEVVSSSASLVWNQRRLQSDRADPQRIGREWLEKTAMRDASARSALGRYDRSKVLSLSYDAMNQDWRRELARIYDFIELTPCPSATERMTAVVNARSHRGHRHSLEQFGLSSAMVETAMLRAGRTDAIRGAGWPS